MAFVISLWDLGYGSKIPVDHNPVASMGFNHNVSKFDVQASADGMGIHICIVARSPPPHSPPSTVVKVLEIFPSSPCASFSQITEFSLAHPLLCYSFNGDLFAFSYIGHVGVRNYVSNMAVLWQIDKLVHDVCDVRQV
jgi:hypothetical protein